MSSTLNNITKNPDALNKLREANRDAERNAEKQNS